VIDLLGVVGYYKFPRHRDERDAHRHAGGVAEPVRRYPE